jgi:hypothetical protein
MNAADLFRGGALLCAEPVGEERHPMIMLRPGRIVALFPCREQPRSLWILRDLRVELLERLGRIFLDQAANGGEGGVVRLRNGDERAFVSAGS